MANEVDNTVSLLLGNGDGTLQPLIVISGLSGPVSLAMGDFNADGKLDLAVTEFGSSEVSILLGNGDGTFTVGANYATDSLPFSVVTADFNGDGKLDLALENNGTLRVFLGNGDGTFQNGVNYSTGTNYGSVIAADLNADGKLDLVTLNNVNPGSSMVLLLGNGDGTFQPAKDYPTGVSPGSVVAGDFNNDGKMDVVSTYGSSISAFIQTPVALSPPYLLFGVHLIGATSSPQAVTLTNNGVPPLTISGITIAGTNSSDFAQTNNCPASQAGGSTCTINVTFTPTAEGTRSATVSISDTGPRSPQLVSLRGQGTVVSLSPPTLNFGNEPVGMTSGPQTVTLVNTGSTTLFIQSIAIQGLNHTDFAEINTCGRSVPGKGSCSITVTFTPTATGSRKANVVIQDTGGGSPQRVSLSGTGT